MPSFLDNLIGTVNTPSNAFAFGAQAANALYPAAQGFGAGDAGTISAVIAAQQAEADRQYGLSKQQLDQNYKIALMNARSQQDVARANAEYQQGQLDLARQRLAFDQQTQAQEFGLKQANLGYNVLGTLANLRGPANVFQAAEYSRGVSQMPETPTFLSALQRNSRLADYGAQGGIPTPESYGTLAAKLTGDASGGVAGPDPNNALAAIGNLAARGAHQLGAGSLESLTPTEMGIFTSGLDKLGLNKDDFLAQYGRSRIGQSTSGVGYRAA